MEDHTAQRSRSRWAAILAAAVLAALLGGLTGGALVFAFMDGRTPAASPPAEGIEPSPGSTAAFMDGRAPAASPPAEAIEPSPGSTAIPQISMTVEIDSAVTQAVSQVGPAVVTVVAHLPRQITFFGTFRRASGRQPGWSGGGNRRGPLATADHLLRHNY